MENEFQQNLFKTLKIETFQDYYALLGYGNKTDKDVYESIIRAVKNSRKKGYHADEEDLIKKNQLPPLQE